MIDADKHSAAELEEPDLSLPEPEKVIRFVNSLPKYKNYIDEIREELFEWAREKHPEENEIMVLSAPTGSGKTLSGVLVGLKGKKRRLIYSLPFISIIEQTGSVLSNAFDKEYILMYHHLSYNWNETENVDLESRMMLAESWSHPIIVTTFEAFVSSFLSNKNSYLKRLHNLANSFIIFDEVQSLPVEKVALVIEAIKEMNRNLNTGVLLMSATVPFPLENIEKPVKMVPDRYTIHFKELDSYKTPSDLTQLIDLSRGSVMIEMNSVASAEEVYQSLRRKDVQYLSTRVIPKERIKRIFELKEKLNRHENVILVTTQVVEAGVDLDFTTAYRDLGPFDSIVQTAGRVNRNNKNKGDLWVYRIKRKGRERSDFELVYGKITENITLNTLKELSINKNLDLDEKNVEKALSIYFSKVKRYLRPDQSRFVEQTLENIKKLEYDLVDVKLIDQMLKYTVFVEYDDEAKEIWNELNSELNEKIRSGAFAKRAKIKTLIGRAQQYIVNLWEKPEAEYSERLGWFYVPYKEVERHYDKMLGFRTREKDSSEDLIW